MDNKPEYEPVLVNKHTGVWEHNIYPLPNGRFETRVPEPNDELGSFWTLYEWETLEDVKEWACALNHIDPDEYDLMDYFTGAAYC